jgi:hypothetical protein
MPPFARIIFGALAVFVIWTIIRAIRSGSVFTRGIEFNIDEQPFVYSLALGFHLLIAAFLVWCAAGYDPGVFFRALGIPSTWNAVDMK